VREPLIVLKFGGSVLADEGTLPLAVHEIHRWRGQGFSVVAVVSALAGVTDELLRRSRAACLSPSPHAVAALVGGGEAQSAALLGLQLDAAGEPARVLSPATLGLIATGDPLDATPVALDIRPLRRALAAGEVAVVPGFVARAPDGRGVLLGRGGSDLTALFLAARLGADRCRLVKDVDGLYARDPALPGPAPPRFATASWADALATDGTIVQHKALLFAREHGLAFELGCWNGTRPTWIGAPASRLEGAPERRARLRVALLGLGTVGAATWQRLAELDDSFELVAVAVREPSRPRPVSPPRALLTTDVLAAASCGADVVVETLGGCEAARAAVTIALRAGAHVVSANKTLLARHGEELAALAQACGVSLRWSAAVGGSTPMLAAVARAARAGPTLRVDAVLNGTTNFVLDAVAAGAPFERALEEARAAGLAERDTDRDLSGRDAADKLALLHQAATGRWLPPEAVDCTPVTPHSAAAAARPGAVVRQVAMLVLRGSACSARVRPLALAANHPLAGVTREGNAAVIRTGNGTRVVRGKGAGGGPTSTAILGDLLELLRAGARRPSGRDREQAVAGREAGRAGGIHDPELEPALEIARQAGGP